MIYTFIVFMKDLAYWRPDSIAVSKTKQVNYKQTHTHTHTHRKRKKKKKQPTKTKKEAQDSVNSFM